MSDHEKLVYRPVRSYAPEEVATLISRDDPRELLYVPVGIGMYSDDSAWAEGICITLAHHRDPIVRGNALVGIAHIARRFGAVNEAVVIPVIKAGQSDPNEYVRGHANDAWDDFEQFVMSQPNRHNDN